MLKTFRNKNVAKMVLWALLILILPAFVLWGSGSLGRSKAGRPSYVGIIYGRKVSFDDFAGALKAMRCRITLNYFGRQEVIDEFFKSGAFMGKLAWDQLILMREAGLRNIKIPDDELVNFIRSHPLFARNGAFDERIYEHVLKNYLGLAPRDFEEIVREILTIKKSNDIITKDVALADDEIEYFYKRDNEKYRISYALVGIEGFLDKVKVDDGEIRGYYDDHRVEFMLAPREGGRAEEGRIAEFEEVKPGIAKMLAENKAGLLALEKARKVRDDMAQAMEKEKLSFEDAASRFGLKLTETPVFSKSDRLEGIGPAGPIANEAAKLKKDELSGPMGSEKGVMIFKVMETRPFDEEKFKKEKDEYSKALLAKKKNSAIEEWLRKAELGTTLNINLEDYEKYYK